MKKQIPLKIIIVLLLACIIGATLTLAFMLLKNSAADKAIKKDYFTVNQIKYGMLSGDNWSKQVSNIITLQVDSFHFTPENKKVLEEQINRVLNRLFDEADAVMHKKHDDVKTKIKFKILNSLVDINTFKAEIPRFSHAIIDELDKSRNKEQIKQILKDKVTGILNGYDQDVYNEQQTIINKYTDKGIEDFNKQVYEKTVAVRSEQRNLGYMLVGILVFILLLWILVLKTKVFYKVMFMSSVIVSFIALFIGVNLPMIEIDARIARLDLKLLAGHIRFDDQVIFYQTKSILDVVHILVTQGKADSVFVGSLILCFSVLFPVTKLICASIYLFMKNKGNRFINYMAFKSGKWSMADVMVVAIFMAYVGFHGILDSELQNISAKTETINVITTNKTNLQTGFVIFVAFVLFNLVLAEILEYTSKKEKAVKA